MPLCVHTLILIYIFFHELLKIEALFFCGIMTYFLGCSRCTGAIVSASLLAVILSICVAVFTSVIVYLLRDKILNLKEKMNIRSEKGSGLSATARIPDYEDVRRHRTGRPKSTIDTKKNVAYGQGCTASITVSQ